MISARSPERASLEFRVTDDGGEAHKDAATARESKSGAQAASLLVQLFSARQHRPYHSVCSGGAAAPPERPLSVRVLSGLCTGGSTTLAEGCFFDLIDVNNRESSATS